MGQSGLRNSGMPLGGLGTGSVELRSDGCFHEWQIMNNAPWGAGPDVAPPLDSLFFALQVQSPAACRSVILGLPPAHNGWLNDPYHIPWVEHPRDIIANTAVPFTTLEYRVAGLQMGLSLEAFSPFIPLDERNSGLPAAYLVFTLRNRCARTVTVAFAAALRNLTGYSEPGKLSAMRFGRSANRAFVELRREGMPSQAMDDGTMVLGTLPGRGIAFSYALHPRNSRDIWEPLRGQARLEDRDHGAFKGELGNAGDTRRARLREGLPHAVLCQTATLKAGASLRIGFVLAWHFPHFRERNYPARKAAGSVIGHRYAEWFGDAVAVYEYASGAFERLRRESRTFADACAACSLPGWLVQAVTAQFTTLVKSSWWDRRGRFGIWEGLGCCGLQTTDITYYGSFPIVQFFPEIQKSQMRLTRDNTESKGKVPHMMPGTFACGDKDERGRIDLIPQFVLLVWRDALWTGDLAYAREMWPAVTDALELFRTFDTDGDGLPNNRGPDQTYDQFPLKGTSAFVGFLYAAALHAAAQLADALGQADAARTMRARLSDAMPKLDQQLWNGSYYRLCYEPADKSANEGVMADQVNADWFVRQTTGEGLLPDGRVRSALRAVLRHCATQHRFLVNCAWPAGGAITIGRHTADQANWPWSGVEYALAAHLALMGMKREALRVARDVWERYEDAGLRFNHIECGGHYYRALSSWALLLALSGLGYNALRAELRASPSAARGRFPFCTPSCWGTAACGTAVPLELTLSRGSLSLRRIVLHGVRAARLEVSTGSVRNAVRLERSPDGVVANLARSLVLRPGVRLRVRVRGAR